jgi:hypothetical protein
MVRPLVASLRRNASGSRWSPRGARRDGRNRRSAIAIEGNFYIVERRVENLLLHES